MSTNKNSELELAYIRLDILPLHSNLMIAREQLKIARASEYKSQLNSRIANHLRELDPLLQRRFELTGEAKL